jgi:hypothetical protein
MILPQTAADNGGLCGQCIKIPPEIRAKMRGHLTSLEQGSLFLPDESELASAATPSELNNGTVWALNAEFYADKNFKSPADAVAAARNESQGNVFLVSENDGKFNLGFTEAYGVCEYQNQEAGEYRYAYSKLNLSGQVPSEQHVVQACPCCGVGMLWYPSRYHMPRQTALSAVECILRLTLPNGISWLEIGDISYTECGRG